jgi:hypothetical protein
MTGMLNIKPQRAKKKMWNEIKAIFERSFSGRLVEMIIQSFTCQCGVYRPNPANLTFNASPGKGKRKKLVKRRTGG